MCLDCRGKLEFPEKTLVHEGENVELLYRKTSDPTNKPMACLLERLRIGPKADTIKSKVKKNTMKL